MTLQDEIRRRRAANLPPLTAEEQRQFQQNLTDTAAVDARMSEIGSTKTTMKGAKIVNGAYKGLTPAQAAQAAMTGAMPPGKFAPGRLGSVRGSLTGDSLYGPQAPRIAPPPTAAPAPAPAPVSQSPAPRLPGSPPSAVQSLTTVPSLSARPPLAAARNAPAPRAPGMINGQAAPQFFQDAANRQGIPNSYGTIKPQAAAPAPTPAPSPAPAAAPTTAASRPPSVSAPRIAPPMAAARRASPPMVSAPPSGMPQNLRVPSKNALGNPALNPYTQVDNTMKGTIAPFMKAPAPTGAAAPIPNRAVDPALADSRGFATPDAAAPGNWEYRPMEQKAADNLRAIAGRGDDGVSRALQVVNPFTMFQTLKQGGTSALPSVMGAQPIYANANDRLKGDTAAIKSARDSGFLKTQKTTDKFGEPITQIATPFVRGTNQPAPARPAKTLQPPQLVMSR